MKRCLAFMGHVGFCANIVNISLSAVKGVNKRRKCVNEGSLWNLL